MKEIAPGLIVYDNPYGSSNITSITTPEGTILIDSSLFPSKAEQVKVYVKRLLNSEITLVINTHYHPDHTFGNSGFSAPICCSSATEALSRKMDRKYIQYIIDKEPLLEKENLIIVPPSITFEKEYEIEFGGLKLQLETVGGHTPDSILIRIPHYGVLIAGDLVVSGYHPEIVQDSNIRHWVKILRALKREHFKQIIPGHGAVARDLEIDSMRSYLEKCIYLQEHKPQLETLLDSLKIDPNFRDRKMSAMFVENLRAVLNQG